VKPLPERQPPTRLGRYEIVRELGAGGQGRVYEAMLAGPGGLRMPVALKVMPGGQGLGREARIGGLLRHRHLVDVYEVGTTNGLSWCAMELCRGGSLARYLPLPPRAVVDVGLQVCAALTYAHTELGLVHLDLKPANLLVADGVIKVGDLGIARAAGFEDPAVMGTSGYTSPEQAAGRPVDARSDIWTLGVVLHVLATGDVPHSSATFSLDDVGPSAAPDAVPWLASVLRRCFEADPAARYASMAELALALGGVDAPGEGLAAVLRADEPAEAPAREAPVLVGRSAEIAEIRERVQPGAVLTLRGPGGVGKTSLARSAAPDGIFCDLSAAGRSADVLAAMGVALGIAAAADLAEQIGQALAERGETQVVLDNFEQVLEAAPLVARWRAAAPKAAWIVTSRERLRIADEVVLDVAPLGPEDAVRLLTSGQPSAGATCLRLHRHAPSARLPRLRLPRMR
jgi:hypothetical protein